MVAGEGGRYKGQAGWGRGAACIAPAAVQLGPREIGAMGLFGEAFEVQAENAKAYKRQRRAQQLLWTASAVG